MALDRIVVDVGGPEAARGPLVVLLHGFGGRVDDLAPFARALGVAARFVVPHGIVDLAPRRGRAWWPIDVAERDRRIARGEARDLSALQPDGLSDARCAVVELLGELEAERAGRPLVLAGFSQGGMLSLDVAFRTDVPLAALAMFSGARIGAGAWQVGYGSRAGLPVLVTHGRDDRDLAFEAAESFQAELAGAGLAVTWCPFDGGHEIPLPALRAFKKLLKEL